MVSRCLELAACRYNGQAIRAPIIRELEPFVELEPVCPEVEIGLGVPRDPIQLVQDGEALELIRPGTGKILTGAMRDFSERYLGAAGEVDGFLLKSRPDVIVVGVPVFALDGVRPHVKILHEGSGHLVLRGEWI
ncbi:MAG: DUF523 domain-containing protein [Fidelibacterota bacterium]